MDEKNLKELFKQAAEIAEAVPESIRETAFNRALDALLRNGRSGSEGETDDSSDVGRTPKAPRAARKESPDRIEGMSRRQTGRPGPKVALAELVTGGFFSVPRTIGDIQGYLESKRGHKYRATDLSPALVRLLREEVLDREKNTDGQYEYSRHTQTT